MKLLKGDLVLWIETGEIGIVVKDDYAEDICHQTVFWIKEKKAYGSYVHPSRMNLLSKASK